jgi:hypothetical protein
MQDSEANSNPIERLALVELGTELKFLKENLDKERSNRQNSAIE